VLSFAIICDQAHLRVEQTQTPWTNQYQAGQVIQLPIAHGEGSYYAPAATLNAMEANHQVLFRYCQPDGAWSEGQNPNGSLHNIAGICNPAGNILGMMPHPERAADPLLGGLDGLTLFQSLQHHNTPVVMAV